LSESITQRLVTLSDEQRVFLLLGLLLDKEYVRDLLTCDSRTSANILTLADRILELSSEIRVPLCLTLLRESLHAIENVNSLISEGPN